MFHAIKQSYYQIKKKNLPVYIIPDSENINDYVTTKQNIKNGENILPKSEFRCMTEDLYQDSGDAGSDTMSQKSKKYNENEIKGKDRAKTLVGDKSVSLKDFDIIKVIGRGSFGKVFLVQKKDDKQVFAMKSLKKDIIIDFEQVQSTKLEQDILL